ncbi:MAG: type II and III secretion system protein [Elusimicrobia bacterium]|nr:type II and III secretion system protein [Elusimicrobiota bacterium]
MTTRSLPALALLAALCACPALATAKADLVAVNVDVVEISGSTQKTIGFDWQLSSIEFDEKTIPGIFQVGEFERKTGLVTYLKLLETEGRAQVLSNPRVVVKSGEQGTIMVGGEVPIPYTNSQGVGADFKKFGVQLEVVPTIIPEEKNAIRVGLHVLVSNPDYSQTVTVSNTTIPSMVTRDMVTDVMLNSGETLVLGGLKQSSRNFNQSSVPFLGKIPIIGYLFKTSDTTEVQRSLFIFVTVEIVK